MQRTLLILAILTGLINPDFSHPGKFISKYNKTAGYLVSNQWKSIHSLVESYKDYIDNVEILNDDVVFKINGDTLFYCDGKMLRKSNLDKKESFTSIMYKYPGEQEDIELINNRYSTPGSSDFTDVLFGTNTTEIREQCKWVPFLDHAAFMNLICADELAEVEKEILKKSENSPEIRKFISELKIIYSFKRRNVSSGFSQSYHSYGLALDLVPNSYNEKAVFWKWTWVSNKCWHLLPMNRRWSPPVAVIEAFENHGFIWGGKWFRYDNIHFEYRPEILEYNKIKLEYTVPYLNRNIQQKHSGLQDKILQIP